MNQEERISQWKTEERQPFIGWDFSYLDGRMFEDQPPWSYSARAAELMHSASSVLDIGTGGGERLLKLRPTWPARVVAIEDYPPNVALATERLAPFGVRVVNSPITRRDPMPFSDGEFDLVVNRHSGFNPCEVARILAPGGTFFTQQVDGYWAWDLQAIFGVSPKWPDATLQNSVSWLSEAGLEIAAAREWSGGLAFADVSAIVYYLRAVPWLVTGFSVETHLAGLMELQARLDRGEPLRFTARKFLIEARKPHLPPR